MSIQTINENDYIKDSRAVINSNFTELDTNKAPLNSPAFTGTPTAPTPTAGDDSTKVATTAYVREEIRQHASMPIGHEYFSMNPNIPQGSLPLFGGEYSRTTYSDLWAWVQTQTGYCKTEAEWQTLSTANNGNVPFYSDGNGSTTFRVPALKCWIKGKDGVETVGTYLDAGLPNITGSAGISNVDYNSLGALTNLSGAFSQRLESGTVKYPSVAPSTYSGQNKFFDFSASTSNSIYGNANTVVPESIVGMWLVKAYGTIEDTGTIDEQQYIDDRIAALPNTFLPLAGGTMTGDLTVNGNIAVDGYGYLISVQPNSTNGSGGCVAKVDNGLRISSEAFGYLYAGGMLELNGRHASSNPGRFHLAAQNTTQTSYLTGWPYSTLQWKASDNASAVGIRIVLPSLTKGTNPSTVKYWNLATYGSDTDDSNRFGLIQGKADTGGNNSVDILAYASSSSTDTTSARISIYMESNGNKFLRPGTNGDVYLGGSAYRWKQLYATTTTIATSDERAKDNIDYIPNEVLDAWGEVDWYQFQFKDAIAEKGENARLHNGLIAQRIKSVFEAHGLDASRYGLFCYDEWDAVPNEIDEDGNIIHEGREAGNQYSLRYEEALAMEAAYQRRRADRLEERIARLEELLRTE